MTKPCSRMTSNLDSVLGFLVIFTVNPRVHPHGQALQRPSVPQPSTHTQTRTEKTHTHACAYRVMQREKQKKDKRNQIFHSINLSEKSVTSV